jgi:hypothetical protein
MSQKRQTEVQTKLKEINKYLAHLDPLAMTCFEFCNQTHFSNL